ncbi:MAG: hypothetical protein AABZ29_06700 [Gemmatimonadota bacterium]|mgnify:CR=1 FL=1
MTPMLALLQAIPPLPPITPHEVIYQAQSGGEVAIAAIVMGTMTGMLYPLIRAWARRVEGRNAPAVLPSREVEERLDRIERAVEAIAVEMERVSEGQRFVTKLLAEKPAAKLSAPER